MSKKRKKSHMTTKNTLPKPPITKLAEYTMDVNGVFTIVTDITDTKVFDKIYRQWWDDPATFMWCGESLVLYIKEKMPKCICVLKDDFNAAINDYEKRTGEKGFIPATKEEYEAENN